MMPFFPDINYRKIKNANVATIQAKDQNTGELIITKFDPDTGQALSTFPLDLTEEDIQQRISQLQLEINQLQNKIDDLNELKTDIHTETIKLKDHL